MNKFFFCLTLFVAMSSQAATKLETRILETIIENANSISVVFESEAEGEQRAPRKEQLPALFAKALLQNYSGMSEKGGSLSNVSIACDERTESDELIVGGVIYICELTFAQGDFKKKNSSLKGPNTEEGIFFSIEVMVPNNPKYDIEILTKKISAEVGC